MFAIIRCNGKQFKVKEGDVVDVDLLDQADKKQVEFSDVLLIGGDKISMGQPSVKGATVTGEVMGEVKAKKVIAYKFKRRKGYHRTVGHRQRYLRVKINKIKA
ncbi:MAG: 50S ribosomal protein L21 [Verrucomicrobiota bacterium]